MLGATVIQGRTFTEAEDSPNGGRVVVLSYALWKSRFGGNSKIVGSTIQLDGQPYLVVRDRQKLCDGYACWRSSRRRCC